VGTLGPYLKLIWSCYRRKCSHECHVSSEYIKDKDTDRHTKSHAYTRAWRSVSLLVVGNFNERRCNLQYHGFHAGFKEQRPVVSRVIRLSLKDQLQDIKIPEAPYSTEPGSRAIAGLADIREVLTSNSRERTTILTVFC
jgi:hypothetical protein